MSAESALTQIKDRKHFASLSRYSGDRLFVRVTYDEQSKTHECRIERFFKQSLK